MRHSPDDFAVSIKQLSFIPGDYPQPTFSINLKRQRIGRKNRQPFSLGRIAFDTLSPLRHPHAAVSLFD